MKHIALGPLNQKEPARFVRVSANLMGHFANWKFDPSRFVVSFLNDAVDCDRDDQVYLLGFDLTFDWPLFLSWHNRPYDNQQSNTYDCGSTAYTSQKSNCNGRNKVRNQKDDSYK
jgi:hypothetical protein